MGSSKLETAQDELPREPRSRSKHILFSLGRWIVICTLLYISSVFKVIPAWLSDALSQHEPSIAERVDEILRSTPLMGK